MIESGRKGRTGGTGASCPSRPSCRSCLLVAVIALSTLACSSSKSTPDPSRAPAPPAPVRPGASQLWGDLKPIVSVKELMRDMLDPASDYIFDSVKVVIGKNGPVETVPKTDKDWEKIRIGA